jgi:hypothetical protein
MSAESEGAKLRKLFEDFAANPDDPKGYAKYLKGKEDAEDVLRGAGLLESTIEAVMTGDLPEINRLLQETIEEAALIICGTIVVG